jgi:glucose/arabinose dehydrogenase
LAPDGSRLYVGVGSNSNITENGIQADYERTAIWEVDRASGAHRIFADRALNRPKLIYSEAPKA